MKTKLLKKLIAAMCAATMVTSCAVMSVGAVPIQFAQSDWTQSRNKANELVDRVHAVDNAGRPSNQCRNLANELEEFFNGLACCVALNDMDFNGRAAYLDSFNFILTNLRSNDSGQRLFGTGHAVDRLSDLAEVFQNMH